MFLHCPPSRCGGEQVTCHVDGSENAAENDALLREKMRIFSDSETDGRNFGGIRFLLMEKTTWKFTKKRKPAHASSRDRELLNHSVPCAD